MTPHPKECSNPRCRNKGRDLTLAHFRKGDSEPECYVYHKQCSECRKARQIHIRFISSLLLQKLVAKNAKAATDYGLRVDFQINIKEMNIVNFVVPYIVTE